MTISIGFFGTPALAASVLRSCLDAPDMLVRYAVTQPDKPAGRSGAPKPSPVKSLALAHGLPAYSPARVRNNAELLAALRTMPVDYLVVVAYGRILPDEILALPRLLPVNVHGSILPAYRGAAPIQAAVAAGDSETGVTIMRMTAGMDEGEAMSAVRIAIDPADTSGTLFSKFAEVSGDALVDALRRHAGGRIPLVPQEHALATYTRKISKEDGLLRYDAPAKVLHDRVRALSPWPGAYDFFAGKALRWDRTNWTAEDSGAPPGTVVRLLRDGAERVGIATPDGCLILEEVTLE